MAKPVWITPAGTLGTVPEGVFFQTALLADIEPVAVVNCTATSSGSNRVTCTSTAEIYPGLQVMFSLQSHEIHPCHNLSMIFEIPW